MSHDFNHCNKNVSYIMIVHVVKAYRLKGKSMLALWSRCLPLYSTYLNTAYYRPLTHATFKSVCVCIVNHIMCLPGCTFYSQTLLILLCGYLGLEPPCCHNVHMGHTKMLLLFVTPLKWSQLIKYLHLFSFIYFNYYIYIMI